MKITWKKLRLTEKKLEPPESRPTKDYDRTSPTQYVLYIFSVVFVKIIKSKY